jgi:lipoprotein signal peptidase
MYSVFYWLTRADSVKQFFDTSSNIFTVLAVLAFIGYIFCSLAKSVQVSENNIKDDAGEKTDADVRSWETSRKFFSKFAYTMLPFAIIFWLGYVFTPTKKECLLIVAGGAVGNFIASDSSARALPSDITKFLHLSINKEIEDLSTETKEDIKGELGIKTPKDKLIESVKDLTKEQIIEYLKKDSTLSIK